MNENGGGPFRALTRILADQPDSFEQALACLDALGREASAYVSHQLDAECLCRSAQGLAGF